jgi:recombination protein RecT
MAKKTAIRRLFKYLPVSIEMQRAVTLDEQADAGILQDHNVVDMETGEYTPPPELEYSIADQIAAAKDLQTLQAIGEAMDALPDGPEKENITQALVAKDAELAGQA